MPGVDVPVRDRPAALVAVGPALVRFGVAVEIGIFVGEDRISTGAVVSPAEPGVGRLARPDRRGPERVARRSPSSSTRNRQPWVKPADGARIASSSRPSTSARDTADPGRKCGPCDVGGWRLEAPCCAPSHWIDDCGERQPCVDSWGRLRSWAREGHPIEQTGRRLLRHPRSGARRGPATRGRGSPDHQAEHRQPGTVRLRSPGRDPRRRQSAISPSRRATRTRTVCCPPAPRSCSTTRSRGSSTSRRRRRLARQRSQRADLHLPAGDARRR